jgi:RHS repeat-associated protein
LSPPRGRLREAVKAVAVGSIIPGAYAEQLGIFPDAMVSDVGYAGYVDDRNTTGLMYTPNRYLSLNASFMSVDPSGSFNLHDPRTFNQYAYVAGNPLTFVDPAGTTTWFVGGTWSDADYPNTFSRIKPHIANLLNDPDQVDFSWSTGNTRSDRSKGASDLADAIMNAPAGEPINVVAHSHGGNLVLEAASILADYNRTQGTDFHIDNAILIGTPVRDDYPVPEGIFRNLVLISNMLDGVQTHGGYNKKGGLLVALVTSYLGGGEYGDAGRVLPCAGNILLSKHDMSLAFVRPGEPKEAHSAALHSLDLWRFYIDAGLNIQPAR